MKILAIRGKNLASLEGEFEVDFTVEPLRSAGLFAITGSTGSGKSTLLDAICLALFNDTPRINRATDNADIVDVKNLTIKQKDSRNILRRGTSDGYAEVDFVALSGDKIRARWSVRRSRDKIDGSLQNATYRVYNLTTNSELQGGKSEQLTIVRDLVGLTFDQFTRSVLLAQGDFATFLKAGKNEKAELLEKLTGTDIYSRISAKIYENTKEAETKLSLITERIKDVEILTPEQLSALVVEQETATAEIAKLDGELEILSKKIEWINADEQLNISLSTAQVELSKSEIAINEAKPRVSYIARVDSVQEIRDDFKQLSNDKKQLETDSTSLKEQQDLIKVNLQTLTKSEDALKIYRAEQAELNNKWSEIEPQIKEARKLDTQIDGATHNCSEAENELKQFVAQQTKSENSIPTIVTTIKSIEKLQVEISTWFETNKIYSDIIARIDLLSIYIVDLQDLQDSITQKKADVVILTKSRTKEDEQLERQESEAHRLNTMLPTEVAFLRAQLVENQPCPVCGSTHHPISGADVDSLEEKALNEAKEIVAKEIERLKQSIAHKKEQLLLSNSSIINYKKQHDKLFVKLTESFRNVPNWQAKYEAKTLKAELDDIATQWQYNIEQQISLKDQLSEQNQDLKATNNKLLELSKLVADKDKQLLRIIDELSKLKNARKLLLDNANADSVESAYKAKIDLNNNNIVDVTNQRDLLKATYEKLSGIITQIESRIKSLTLNIADLDNTVALWLSKREEELGVKELAELLSKDNNWITTERESLATLEKSRLSAQTTMSERQLRVKEHNKVLIKPSELDTLESLTVVVSSQKEAHKKTSERKTEITIALINHEKGTERIQKFEKELLDKGAIAENWGKLNILFGSADGAKFKVLAQGYTLDVLLGYANKHLKDISQRYVLERVSAESLALQVVDLDMLSEVRSVHSLSGGESFLISLALALGLSSLSSNRMRVESLFIDEGFGTLDAETLRVAMDALEGLQTQGRKIGVISHVTEMTERISTQIKVVKDSNGRSHIEVVGI